jgi:hypothetical protein
MRILLLATLALLTFSFFSGARYLPLPQATKDTLWPIPDDSEFKAYYNHYLLSDTYRKRLKNGHYKNPDKTIADRLTQLNTTYLIATDNYDTQFQPFDPEAPITEHTAHGPRVNLNWDQLFKYKISLPSVLAHESTCAQGCWTSPIGQCCRLFDLDRGWLPTAT